MRTCVYIDGYNLYYGRLRRTPYKWLDVVRLFTDHIVKTQSPDATIERVKYFTADIKARLASRGQLAQISQADYHRALSECYPDKIDLIKGYHSLEYASLPRYQRPPDKYDRVEVWRLEEKQTDVNIALHLYRDVVVKQTCDQVVLVSNDTDLEPVMRMIREDVGNAVTIGIVIPMPKPQPNRHHRPPNEQLSQFADWTRRYILDNELAESQLPEMIPTRKKPIRKPDYW